MEELGVHERVTLCGCVATMPEPLTAFTGWFTLRWTVAPDVPDREATALWVQFSPPIMRCPACVPFVLGLKLTRTGYFDPRKVKLVSVAMLRAMATLEPELLTNLVVKAL